MTNIDTVQELGKYLNKIIWIKFKGESPKTETLTLEILKTLRDHPFQIDYIYPILKASESLNEKEQDRLDVVFKIFENYIESPSIIYKIFGAYKLVRVFSELDLYCEPSKSSPTGYKSLLDGLSCKCWSNVFK